MLRGCLVCVICNSNNFHSLIFKLCIMIVHTLNMCTCYFCAHLSNTFLFLGLLDLDILSIRNAKGVSGLCKVFILTYLSFVRYDCSHIEHVHPVFCVHLVILLRVFNLTIITSTPPLEYLHCVICM